MWVVPRCRSFENFNSAPRDVSIVCGSKIEDISCIKYIKSSNRRRIWSSNEAFGAGIFWEMSCAVSVTRSRGVFGKYVAM